MKIGDPVLIVDETVQRHEWKMARVIEVEGSDGLPRRAIVRRSNGKLSTYDRTNVVRLELG